MDIETLSAHKPKEAGVSHDGRTLARLIEIVTADRSVQFTHFVEITGTQRTARLYFCGEPIKIYSEALESPILASTLALELMLLTKNGVARYEPEKHSTQHKGWSVSVCTIPYEPKAILIQTAWS